MAAAVQGPGLLRGGLARALLHRPARGRVRGRARLETRPGRHRGLLPGRELADGHVWFGGIFFATLIINLEY